MSGVFVTVTYFWVNSSGALVKFIFKIILKQILKEKYFKLLMLRDRGWGWYVSKGTSLPYDFWQISLSMNRFFCVSHTHRFLLLRNEVVNKRHLNRKFDVARFCCQNCLLNIGVYHVNLHVFFFYISNSIFGVNVRVAQQIYVFKVKSCLIVQKFEQFFYCYQYLP